MTKREALDNILQQIKILKSELKTLKTQEYINTYKFEIAVKEEAVRALKESINIQSKLKEYEDTGLTPEQIRQLKKVDYVFAKVRLEEYEEKESKE